MATKFLRVSRYASNVSSLRKRWNDFRLEEWQVPERFKGRVYEKWMLYWKGLMMDYRDVFVGVARGAKEKPIKASTLGLTALAAYYCAKNNPSETDFYDRVIQHKANMVLVHESCLKPESAQYLTFLERCSNEGVLRKLNLGVVSVLWVTDYNKVVKLFKATCEYTQPDFLSWKERIIDIGFLGKWIKLEQKMVDYDVNETNL